MEKTLEDKIKALKKKAMVIEPTIGRWVEEDPITSFIWAEYAGSGEPLGRVRGIDLVKRMIVLSEGFGIQTWTVGINNIVEDLCEGRTVVRTIYTCPKCGECFTREKGVAECHNPICDFALSP